MVADGLSRIERETPNTDNPIECNINESTTSSSSVSNNSHISLIVNERSNASSSDTTAYTSETDDKNFIPMTLLAVNTFSNQIILRIGQPETNEFEEIFPKVFRRTITQLAFTVTNVLDIFKDYMDYDRINCIFCSESLFPTLQYVYRNHFSQNKTLRIKISQTLLIDVTTMEEQNQLIEETHERAHRGISENIKAISAKHYFPHLKKKVTTYINLCKTCKKNKYDRKPYKITFADTPIPKRPLDIEV